MVTSHHYDIAKKCVDHYFKDCNLVDVFESHQVSKPSSSKYLFIKGKSSGITCSRTAKIAMRDNLECKSCSAKSKYALTLFNVNSKKHMISFVVIIDGDMIPLTKDHVVPKMLGGRDTLKNLQSLCYRCNQEKAHDRFEKEGDKKKTITITMDEYNRLNTKQNDFANVRNIIKKSIKRVPWWMKILGVHKYIENKIKNPIKNMGYYGNNLEK